MAPPGDEFDVVKAAEALLESAKSFASAVQAGSLSKPVEDGMRKSIAAAAEKIAAETYAPIDRAKSEYIVMADLAISNILMSWKAFDLIPTSGSISIADLAKAVEAQESLVARFCGFLLATGKLLPGDLPDHIRHSSFSRICVSTSPFYSLNAIHSGNGVRSFALWPQYFATYGRAEPPRVTHTPFSFAWGHPELAPWEVKALYPEYAALFAQGMEAKAMVGGGMPWTGEQAFYDLGWLAGESGAVVDVGGGLGQLLKDVLAEVPGVEPARCVLQDRKEVIEQAAEKADPALEGVVMMEHDFHEEQPVKGASLYLVRRILLDYPDTMATAILRRLADAMSADNPKARLLIVEERLSEPPVAVNRIVDTMMLNLGGKLRNREMMTAVAEAAGLKVVGYHVKGSNPMFVMECAKA
ncbi:Demethylsterigmatocystin 6-O-methyltransferase [Podospora conica]|nr:Demethylsterigmatocystin 6-O-methyltransferase [Schizothecium conicum]